MTHRRFFFILCLVFTAHLVLAQNATNIKFGKLTPADFSLTPLSFDSGANAVILADIGTTKFEGNTQGSFNIIFTHFIRVKIMNKNGFDVGNRSISLYHEKSGDYEKLSAFRASTFNLENGAITEVKLDEKSIFTEKENENYDHKKFTLPALKAGSVFDVEYTIKSPYDFRLEPWSFQGVYPCLWSEYTVTIPPPLHYVMRMQGDDHFFIDTAKEVFQNYAVRVSNGASSDDNYRVSGNATFRKWVKKDIPSLHEEKYTTTIDNYYSKVTFQLSYIQWGKGEEKHMIVSTWNSLSKRLMEIEDFGLALDKENGWMESTLNSLLKDSKTNEERVSRIFEYVRDNFKLSNKDGHGERGIYVYHSLKDVFKNKEGNVAEINLLLTAMIRKAGMNADPMILSTRDNGIADPTYPLVDEYNYVVCVVFIGDQPITLDASKPYNCFGQLPLDCYNGWGHVINEATPWPLYFSSDSLNETSLTNVIIVNDEKGKSTGSYSNNMGKFESYDTREEIGEASIKEYEKKVRTEAGSDMSIENFGIDSLHKNEMPLKIHFEFNLNNIGKADMIYFNPMLGTGYSTNPFKSTDRHYPVEMPYQMDETYLLNMEIPAGYQVEELPQSARVAYNENEGMFEYLIQKESTNIQMRVRLKLNKTLIPVEDYPTLRDFFAFVVKKESEQIVFKKLK